MSLRSIRHSALMLIALAACVSALAAPYGKIGEKYAVLGGSAGALGPAVGIEADAPYGGRLHLFKEGVILWHPEIGEAFAIWGAISVKWWKLGRVEFGYPITDERTTPDGRGRYNHFRAVHLPGKPESSIYWTPQTGAHAVHGLIRDAWAKGGWERGELGYPTSDEFQDGALRRSNFEGGYITWSRASGIRIVKSGAEITRKTPPKTFGSLLVTGLEVAANGTPLAGNATFLSENTVCSPDNVAALSAFMKEKVLAVANPKLKQKFGVTIRDDAQMRLNCAFRAEISQACQREVALRTSLPNGLFKFWINMPGQDAGFSVNFEIEAATRISLPQDSHGAIGIGPTRVKVLNLKFDSHNLTGDALKAAADVYAFFSGEDIVRSLTRDRHFTVPGVETSLAELNPALKKIPANYRIDSCLGDGNVLRLIGTSAPGRDPVVR